VPATSSYRAGVIFAVLAFGMWGLFPLYWKPLVAVPPLEVVAHRTVWGLISVALWVTLTRRWGEVREAIGRPRTLLVLAASAVLIGANWLIYIWAVISNHVVEASLGYFINPLISVLLGVVVLGERLSRRRGVAVALATAAVVVLTVGYGQFPWVALALAGSFALYGLARKMVAADAVIGLLVETALLAPFAAAILIGAAIDGCGALGSSGVGVNALLILSGAVTAIPLVFFTLGARRLPLSTVGLIQYLAPTGQFLLGVLLYRETFTLAHAATFSCIWAALALLAWDLRGRRAPDPADSTALD